MNKPVIGMLHIPALPGAPNSARDLAGVREHVLADARALVDNGVPQLLLENFGDAPFYPRAVPQHVVAHMTSLAAEVKRRFDVPLGINVLRNDGCAALSIAHAVAADFIRVNVLCGARLTDQGIIQGIAHDLLRLRKTLGAERIRILADVDVKHSTPLAHIPLEQEVEDLIHRGLADVLIVSGSGTGGQASIEQLQAVKLAAGETPVYVGSGITEHSIERYINDADGFIVGSSLKFNGNANQPVDAQRVRTLVRMIR